MHRVTQAGLRLQLIAFGDRNVAHVVTETGDPHALRIMPSGGRAGGAHHTGFSQALNTEHMADFAEIADLEFLCIDRNVRLREFRNELRWNEVAYQMKRV